MRIMTAQIRQAIAALDSAEEQYRRHRDDFAKFSAEEPAPIVR